MADLNPVRPDVAVACVVIDGWESAFASPIRGRMRDAISGSGRCAWQGRVAA
jgi:hypothetical protein